MKYFDYHKHTDRSIRDSCTKFEDYVAEAVAYGHTAICVTEHGNLYNWVDKKIQAEEAGLKYVHGVEIYLTENLDNKIRDNYHTVLLAKNFDGVKELNLIMNKATDDNHKYYNARISFDEFLSISDNIISTSACVSSPLNRLPVDNPYYEKLAKKYTYYEIQHHNDDSQKLFNNWLYELSKKYHKPLIVGTDTHSLNKYKAECRVIRHKACKMDFDGEENYDLTCKTYEQLIEAFKIQNALPEEVYTNALNNTIVLEDSIEDFKLDLSFKYPKLYDNDEEVLKLKVNQMFRDKLKNSIIKNNPEYKQNILEEFRVFKKLSMISFMLFMSELAEFCRQNDIPVCPCRGSVGGSTIAYILGITDVDPIVWGTIFSRFANEDRLEIGDIDMDFSPEDREKVYQYIQRKVGLEYSAYILAIGTVADKGCIDEIGRGLEYDIDKVNEIKDCFEKDSDLAKKTYPELFYYYDGLVGTAVSQSMHPAGMVASPVTLKDNYGIFYQDGLPILYLDMEEVHEVSLVKYDILGLRNIQILRDTCRLAKIPYPQAHQIDWNDQRVWQDMITSPIGIFQFEGNFAFQTLKRYAPKSINDMSMITSLIRPACTSFREEFLQKKPHKNPSKIIDDLFESNNGYIMYQEDVIKFLKNICGLSGSEADNVRRAIGRKQHDRLAKALPDILNGYCSKSDQPEDIAVQEAQQFLQILEDSSSYMFNYSHATGYSMIGYLCAYFRYYYPIEFVTALLNNANNEDDVINGTELARQKGIKIKPIRFRHSIDKFTMDAENNFIYKGIESIKYLSAAMAMDLYNLRTKTYATFTDLLVDICENCTIDSRQIKILILLDFFNEFGGNKKLINTYDKFSQRYKKTHKNLTKLKRIIEIKEFEETLPNAYLNLSEQMKVEIEYVGNPITKYKVPDNRFYIIDVETRKSKKSDKQYAIVKAYNLFKGETITFNAWHNTFVPNGVKSIFKYDTADIVWKKGEGGFKPSIFKYTVVKREILE